MTMLSDVNAECYILSAAASKEKHLLELLAETTVDDFTRPETAAIYTVMKAMYDRNEQVSAVSLGTHMAEIDAAGFKRGHDLSFMDVVMGQPFDSDFPAYLERVKEFTRRRNIYRAAQNAITLLDRGEMSDDAYSVIERLMVDRTASSSMTRKFLTPIDMQETILEAVMGRVDEQTRQKRVLFTQFPKLNRATGGLEKGDLIILSAESGAGKSAFAMNLAYGTAFLNRRPTLYLNSEMSNEQMGLRWASFLTKISHSALRCGTESQEDLIKTHEAVEQMGNSKMYWLNIPDLQIRSVLAETRRAKAKYDIEIVFVDYIGRMDSLNSKEDVQEWQVLKSAAQRLKTMAQELGIIVVMVAQLSEDGKKLAQASYMKHEADLWLNLAKMPEADAKRMWPWDYTLTFRKARNVETGKTILMHFHGDTLTFTDRKKDAEAMLGEKPASAGLFSGRWQRGGVPA